jgi:glucosamine--fructose-6-phosphate aminotransferase (isomerizing)
MCGIIGYSGTKQALPILVDGLKKLEYRGYDSWGICVSNKEGLTIQKEIGVIDKVEDIKGTVAIGHTRWATHGKVDAINAHPITDCTRNLAVVHNGIVENYRELKDKLQLEWHTFITETDTEVITHLLENSKNLVEGIIETGKKIVGSYAYVVVKCEELYGTRNGSNPLFVGIKNTEYYISSDYSILPAGTTVYTLEDKDVVEISSKGVNFYDSKGLLKSVQPLSVIKNSVNNYHNLARHYMIEEIEQQPKVLLETLNQNEENLANIANLIRNSKQVVITACGSSRYAGLVGRYLFSAIGYKLCEVVMASEFKYFDASLSKDTLVIAVSQSGETIDVIDGVLSAKQKGAKVVSIINRQNSILSNQSDYVVYLNCGNEIAVAATKSFICQLGVFYMLAYKMIDQFEVCRTKLVDVANLIYKEISTNNLNELAEILKDQHDLYFIARGTNSYIASEGALKLKEVSYSHAEGLPAGELKHGTLSLIEKGTPVIAICPNDYTYNDTLNNAIEAKTRGAYIIGVSDKFDKAFDYWIRISQVEEIFYPMVETIPLQLLAYYLGVIRNCNPDRPRNLSKTVSVR